MFTRVNEIVREQICLQCTQEIPHSVYILTQDMEHTETLLRILTHVYVESESQKKIIIGTKGARIQEIGTLARKELESIFECKVFLKLRVKVKKKWRKNATLRGEILGI